MPCGRSTVADRTAVRTLTGIQAVITLPLIALLALGARWNRRRALQGGADAVITPATL